MNILLKKYQKKLIELEKIIDECNEKGWTKEYAFYDAQIPLIKEIIKDLEGVA